MRLVIVDDEYILLKGLIETYPWEKYGYQVVGSARSGEEALTVIEKTIPDVVISDIRMKKMDGLAMMEKILDKFPFIEFVFVSAYKDFEYVKTAMDLGAYAYLLKPIDEMELETIVSNLKVKIVQDKKERVRKKNWENLLVENNRNFFHSMLKKYLQQQISRENFLPILDTMGLTIDPQHVFIAFQVSIDLAKKVTSPSDFEADKKKLVRQINQALTNQKLTYAFFESDSEKEIFILWNTKVTRDQVKQLIQNIEIENEKIVSVISKEYLGEHGLFLAYEEATHTIVDSMEMSPKQSENVIKKTSVTGTLNEKILFSMIRKGNIKESLKTLEQIFSNLTLEQETVYANILVSHLETILLENHQLTKDLRKAFDAYFTLQVQLNIVQKIQIIEKLIIQIIATLSEDRIEEPHSTSIEYVNQAILYIENNLENTDLSIVSVANHVYLNSVYFGRIFKQIQGVSFKQYLLERRMQKAQTILLSGEERITIVCEEVGFANLSYFSQQFKQYTGILPRDYRRMVISD